MNQARLTSALIQLAAQNAKEHAEIKALTTKLVQQVNALAAAMSDTTVSDAVVEALTFVQATTQVLDDLNPDIPDIQT